MRNAKVDNNQRDIVDVLRRLGCSVFLTHTVGRGFPDLVVGYQAQTYLVEIKNGIIGWKLTDAQKKFRALWNAPIVVLDSVESAITWIGGLP